MRAPEGEVGGWKLEVECQMSDVGGGAWSDDYTPPQNRRPTSILNFQSTDQSHVRARRSFAEAETKAE